VKLRWRAAASNARSAFSGRARTLTFAMPQLLSGVAREQIVCCTAPWTLYWSNRFAIKRYFRAARTGEVFPKEVADG
jgi:hypothetical protein